MGAYLSTYGPYIPTLAGSKVLPSVYRFETVYLNVLGVFTNTVPVDAYRGAGRPESNYLVERLVDAAARDLGIDPVELRRRNMVSAAEMPYRTPVGETYDSGEFARVMDAALARIDRTGFAARRAEAAQRNRCRGLGFACYLEATMGAPEERAEIRFAQDGHRRCVRGHAVHRAGPRDRLCRALVAAAGHPGRPHPDQAGRQRRDSDGRGHRRLAQPLFRGPGDAGDRANRGREGPEGGFRHDGGGGRGHHLRGRMVSGGRHRSPRSASSNWRRHGAPRAAGARSTRPRR